MNIGEEMENILDYLARIRADWRAAIGGAGGKCPCCDRWGRVNKKGLNVTLVRTLGWMAQQRGDKDGWIHMPTEAPQFVKRSNQYSSLAGWNFIERREHSGETDKKHEGFWRVTGTGHDFVDGAVGVPKYVLHYNQQFVGVTGPVMFAKDVCNPFSYREAMS